MGHTPLPGQFMIQIVFAQRNLGGQLAKRANDFPIGLGKNIFAPFGGKQKKRNFSRSLIKSRCELLEISLAGDLAC